MRSHGESAHGDTDLPRPGAGRRAHEESAQHRAEDPRPRPEPRRSTPPSARHRDRDRLGQCGDLLLRGLLGDPAHARRRRPPTRIHPPRSRQRRVDGDLLLHRRTGGAARVRDRRADQLVSCGHPRRGRDRRARCPGAPVPPHRGGNRPRRRLGHRDLDRHRLPGRRPRTGRPARPGSAPHLPARPRRRRRHRGAHDHRARVHEGLHAPAPRDRGRRTRRHLLHPVPARRPGARVRHARGRRMDGVPRFRCAPHARGRRDRAAGPGLPAEPPRR